MNHSAARSPESRPDRRPATSHQPRAHEATGSLMDVGKSYGNQPLNAARAIVYYSLQLCVGFRYQDILDNV